MTILIAGPCAIEAEDICLEIAHTMADMANRLGFDYYFKASFDKANRTYHHSQRGPGIYDGVEILQKIKDEAGVKILTDVHEPGQADFVARVADVIQIPAMLSRQTDLIRAAGTTGRIVNIKKSQGMDPHDMIFAIQKAIGAKEIWITERGTTFGYHNLVVDMRSLVIMKGMKAKVIFDATHSVQRPGLAGHASGGERHFAPPLARAAAAVGVDGFFFETHPDPREAISDGPNMVPLNEMEQVLRDIKAIQDALRK
jgi:2-dehydro-3-deoxyphosphooctonate aldolase (KDO 8-P synthase)